MSETIIKSQAFKLKGRLYTFTVLQLLDPDKEVFFQQCAETVLKAPKLFERTPIVFDLSAVAESHIDLQAFCQIAREHGMIPVGVQGGSSLQDTLAQCQGLALLNASPTNDKPVLVSPTENATDLVKTKMVTTHVRSGQQIVAKGGDLIVTSSVSHGAELLADGNIHVYGALRGRVLAGISGDTEACIFCQSLDAELLSIAGWYKLSDSIESFNGPCRIYLLDEHIHIEPL